jgi:hypothetical protein
VVSERLGHSKIGITMDLYCHVSPGMQEDAAQKIDTGRCQSNANQSPKHPKLRPSGRELTPLS